MNLLWRWELEKGEEWNTQSNGVNGEEKERASKQANKKKKNLGLWVSCVCLGRTDTQTIVLWGHSYLVFFLLLLKCLLGHILLAQVHPEDPHLDCLAVLHHTRLPIRLIHKPDLLKGTSTCPVVHVRMRIELALAKLLDRRLLQHQLECLGHDPLATVLGREPIPTLNQCKDIMNMNE